MRATAHPTLRRSPTTVRRIVGASIWQTPGGIQAEIERINDSFNAFSREITERVTNSPGFPTPTDPVDRGLAIFFDQVWGPLIRSWGAFHAQHKGWGDNFWWNHAPEAEGFLRQLNEVRASAGRIGMQVRSPEPPKFAPSVLFDPGHNVFDDAGEGAEKLLKTDMGSVVKYAAIGLGAVALIAIARR